MIPRMTMKTSTPLIFALCAVVLSTAACVHTPSQDDPAVLQSEWANLLDLELSQWEVQTGKPDASIEAEAKGLLGPDWKLGQPGGIGDPFGLFFVTTDASGELILNLNGKVYGGLTTLESYENYHLTMEVKWGEQQWAPRLDEKRDSGILYHCYGPHGRMWGVWKSSLEMQVQETDIGDLYQLGGPNSLTSKTEEARVWDPTLPASRDYGRVTRSVNVESPSGEWTRIDLYVLGDCAIHVVNGTAVMALRGAQDNQGNSLTSGQIQLQSEGADCYYKDIRIRPIQTFPTDLHHAAGL